MATTGGAACGAFGGWAPRRPISARTARLTSGVASRLACCGRPALRGGPRSSCGARCVGRWHRVAGRSAALPPDDRARPHRHRPGGLDRGHREQLARPACSQRACDPLPHGDRVRPRHGLDVAGQQRHRVPPGDDLAEQRDPDRLRRERGPRQCRAGEPHDPRGRDPTGRHDHRRAVGEPGVGQRDVVQRGLACRPVGGSDERGRDPRPRERHRVPCLQSQRVDDLGMQPDDPAPGVDGRCREPGDERDLGSHPPNLEARACR